MYDVLVRPRNLSRGAWGLGLFVRVKPAAASSLAGLGAGWDELVDVSLFTVFCVTVLGEVCDALVDVS